METIYTIAFANRDEYKKAAHHGLKTENIDCLAHITIINATTDKQAAIKECRRKNTRDGYAVYFPIPTPLYTPAEL